MSTAQTVVIPLLNPNEPEAQLAALHVAEGQQVAVGDPLCTLETTKSAAEVEAETDGYIVGLHFAQGDAVKAGEVLCYLAPDPTWQPPQPAQSAVIEDEDVPAGLRITKPALTLARQHEVDLQQLPKGPMVTASMLQELLVEISQPTELPAPEKGFDETALIIYGGGGHGKSLIDLVQVLGQYKIVGIVDDGLPKGEAVMGMPVLGGGREALPELYAQGVHLAVNAVGGIGDINSRVEVFARLARAGFTCPAVIHPTAFVEPSAKLSPGVQVLPHAYVGSEATLGFGVIANTGATVSHDCVLGNYANVAPGAMLAGAVEIGERTLIGMGATINLNVKVGVGARIGNGATVKSDVPEGGIVRAGAIWPK